MTGAAPEQRSRTARSRSLELTTRECLDVVDQLAELECRYLTLTGGEPLLRHDWDVVARAAARQGMAVHLVTSGARLVGEIPARLVDAGIAGVAGVVEGSGLLHDRLHGAGHLAATLHGLGAAARSGLPVGVLLELDRCNLGSLETVHDQAVAVGARRLQLRLRRPTTASPWPAERGLRPRDLLTLLPRLAGLIQRSPLRIEVDEALGHFSPQEGLLHGNRGVTAGWTGCQAGRTVLGIECDGGVKGCLALNAALYGADDRDPFREGDLRTRRLAEIWFDPGVFAFNRLQRVEDLTGRCRSCSKNQQCRGGAKCLAAAYSGCLTEDPFCYLRIRRDNAAVGHGFDRLRHGARPSLPALDRLVAC